MTKSIPSRRNAISLTSGSALAKLAFIFSNLTKLVGAIPIFARQDEVSLSHNDVVAQTMTSEEFYINLLTSMVLVLAGGVFAGLTLGLMGQDEVYLKVIMSSGEPQERKHARKVLQLIGRGKHWVLVTLLLSNVITNETLPIVLDRCLGGGWPAVVTSTASIVVFGEIIPQSISVRYGLQVGSMFAPFVLVLMYIMYPVAYPCALLLDHILGEDHGTVYKKSGLKTLVTLHKTMGVERLNQDEVTIISAVLDLKEKPVSHIMTPIDRVYTMSADTILDEKTVEEIFNAGFSRIPIHLPNEPSNFIGMLLVRVLISYDPEDALPVASFPLATLPETGVSTSCLNILNYFQEGKSHMIVVSETPGGATGALGVLTLEDVIEELIGEEIVDESDVYIDINKNIKRTQPGPLSKRNLTVYLRNLYQSTNNSKRNSIDGPSFSINREEVPDTSVAAQIPPEVRVEGEANTLTGPVDSAKNWKPKNPALNPLDVNKPFVTIKRTTAETINSVLPAPKRAVPNGTKEYGGIHTSEQGALLEAERRNSESMEDNVNEAERMLHGENGDRPRRRSSSHKFLLPQEREADLTEIRNNHQNGHGSHADAVTDEVANLEPMEIPEYSEARSYRTGGIIESVVNVQGVHKTIIEHVSENEDDVLDIDHLDQVSKHSSGSSTQTGSSSKKTKKKKRSHSFNMNSYNGQSSATHDTNAGEDASLLP